MSTPHATEPTVNYELARLLHRCHPQWNAATVHAETTHVIRDAPGKRPDIITHPPGSHPVIVETEFEPARTVEADAGERLGSRLREDGSLVEGVLSVCLPQHLKTDNLERINTARFRYAAHSLDANGSKTRYPKSGWLEGGVDDLADAIECLALSERQLAQGTRVLERVVRETASLLAQHRGEAALKIAGELKQEPGEQTQRMAAAILTSAFVFHAAIEGHPGIPSVPYGTTISKNVLLDTWEKILAINYWPIFSIARDLAKHLPVRAVPPVMGRIADSISELSQLGATTYHDLTGRMFQRLIADRKFLATFYTLPTSACLLAELAVEQLDVDFSDPDAIAALRVADFACGTGALLSAAQRAIYRRHRRAGGDDAALHPAMMEQALMGFDIMPAATHLTCSMLSVAHPSVAYGRTHIKTMPYGFSEGQAHIGALDLMDSESATSLFATGETLGGTESDSDKQHTVTVMDQSCNLVIMNPPFTRPTNHESSHADVPVPSFAGFGTSLDEQRAMSRRLKRVRQALGSGNAGLASNFMDLAHTKLKDGGVLAMVLPFAFARGNAWAKARQTLKSEYSSIRVVSIAATGSTERAFSADTGMAECLVVATKGGEVSARGIASYCNIEARPASLLEAIDERRRVPERGQQGSILEAGAAGVRSASVIQAARGLKTSELRLPRAMQATPLPIVALGVVAERGLVHRDISGGPTNRETPGVERGPFNVRAIRPSEEPTWPMLWAHDAPRERRLVVKPDRAGEPKPGDRKRAKDRWDRAASRLHSNLDFRLNSQSLAMCLTSEPCLGGSAWPNLLPTTDQYEFPLLLWANSTFGLIAYWWTGARQQQGRTRLTITKLPEIPVLDPRALDARQIALCEAVFEEIKNRDFLPANEAYRDPTRKDLDRRLLVDVLGLDAGLLEPLDLLRRQWCAEPSVHGGKGTRINTGN